MLATRAEDSEKTPPPTVQTKQLSRPFHGAEAGRTALLHGAGAATEAALPPHPGHTIYSETEPSQERAPSSKDIKGS